MCDHIKCGGRLPLTYSTIFSISFNEISSLLAEFFIPFTIKVAVTIGNHRETITGGTESTPLTKATIARARVPNVTRTVIKFVVEFNASFILK